MFALCMDVTDEKSNKCPKGCFHVSVILPDEAGNFYTVNFLFQKFHKTPIVNEIINQHILEQLVKMLFGSWRAFFEIVVVLCARV